MEGQRFRVRVLLICVLLLPFPAFSAERGSATGTQLAVASGGTFSSMAGAEISEAGGSLTDAAIATAFALAVERPFSAGLGGGGFLLLHTPTGDVFLDFRETAPRRATRDMYLDGKGNVVPAKSLYGGLAVATPGFVAGLFAAHERWGRLPWARVLEPAIQLAEKGFRVYPSLADAIASYWSRIQGDAYTRSILGKAGGGAYRTGDTFRQPDLAETLRAIARGGADAFYRGPLAVRIAAQVRETGGIVDEEDLAGYQAAWREPIAGRFQHYRFLAAPPPSAGGVLMVQMTNVLAPFDLFVEAQRPAEYEHLLAETMKRAYADRSYYIGDPAFVTTSWWRLMDQAYADRLRGGIDRERATPSREIRPGQWFPEDHGTAHLSLIDAEGNAAAMTITINGSWGSLVTVPGTGIFLNNEMDDFSVKPGEPNLFGLTGGEANAIAPGKRPVSSMSPTIVLESGTPVLAVGGAGGSRILSSTFQVMLAQLAITPGNLPHAVGAPRVHHQWIPDRLDLEAGFPPATVARLRAKGHVTGPWPWEAQIEAVSRDPASGTITAVFDPRDEGGAEAR